MPGKNQPVIDSSLTLAQSLAQNPDKPPCPEDILNQQRLLAVSYYGFDNKLHRGQIVVNRSVSADVRELFELIKQLMFPIAKVVPVSAPDYRWDAQKLIVKDNVTIGFDYRFIADTDRLSLHGEGLAIDINPRQNPYIRYQADKEIVWPPNSEWDPAQPGTLSKNHEIVKLMEERGWEWGGHWTPESGRTDYQHFQKPANK